MKNKAIILQAGGGYDKVIVGTRDAKDPQAGEITVRLHANSLNYHDFAVVSGMWGLLSQESLWRTVQVL